MSRTQLNSHMIPNPELDLAYQFVQNTNRNIFLTGKAGTGKTTFLHRLREISDKRMVVVAPTGVAAINAGGVTIHSFFQMAFGPTLAERVAPQYRAHDNPAKAKKFNKKKINIIKSMDLLVIDEISMVRADLLDGIDEVLRKYKNRSLPFGGVQVLMIGDLQQLAPVVKPDEWQILKPYYETVFFFSSKALQESHPLGIELKHIYRQQDERFIKILNEIRDNCLSDEALEQLHSRYIPDFMDTEEEGYITLTTHNANARRINEEQLNRLESKSHTFKATVSGQFPDYSFPTEGELLLKTGAQVMFVKNDPSPEKLFYNGKIGKITRIEEGLIYVQCKEDSSPIAVDRETWRNINYKLNEKEQILEEEEIGSFVQYPLRLAWAITIHKSQGLTFEKAIIDAQASFAHGQTYVALSRCKTLEGLVLSSKITGGGIICDQTVRSFTHQVEQNPPDKQQLDQSKRDFQLSLLMELFDYHSLVYRLDQCKKVVRDNASALQGNLAEKLAEINLMPLRDVAEKFKRQLQRPLPDGADYETDDKILDRITKACVYFSEQTQKVVVDVLDQAGFTSDNQASRKLVKDRMDRLNESLQIKMAGLECTKSGFKVKAYVTARAKASMKKTTTKTPNRSLEELVDIKHPDLFRQLQSWRKGVAAEIDQPAYYVASQKLLIQIAGHLPHTIEQLKTIKGLGPKKIEKYGGAIIEQVKTYCQEKEIELPQIFLWETSDKPKIPTKEISFNLYKAGKSIMEIAEERGLSLNTVENHLVEYVRTGVLDIYDFVEKKRAQKIRTYYRTHPSDSLKAGKDALGADFSYSELRFVLEDMKREA